MSFHIQQGQTSAAGTASGPTGMSWKENVLSFPCRISADVPPEKRRHRIEKALSDVPPAHGQDGGRGLFGNTGAESPESGDG